ncbi:hypothetical protein BS78_09G002300 [Paspalum vaginatum]|nr:hypothetical protein BS78_09G002300 [Paspalum vaginatum]
MPWCKWCLASACCVSMRPSNLATRATCERGSRGRNCASPWIAGFAAACPSSLKDGVARPVTSLLIAVDSHHPIAA